MSKFNSYAKRLNEAAKTAFEKYKKAEKAYQAAEDRRRNMPWDATQEQKLLADADVVRAKEDLKAAKEAFTAGRREMDSIRGELAKDLKRAYTANPEDIDASTMELLKSGILSPSEYIDLANRAINNGNNTMLRIIGSHAEKVAEGLQNDRSAMETRGALLTIATRAKNSTGAAELEAYDNLVNTFDRCTNNPAMIDHWDGLTQQYVDSF